MKVWDHVDVLCLVSFDEFIKGATASTPLALSLIASASLMLKVGFVPIPIDTPPVFADAERMVKIFEPIDSMLA